MMRRPIALISLMAVFIIALPTLADDADPFDDGYKVKRLQELGTDVSKPLDVDFYFTGSQEDLANMLARLRKRGFTLKEQPCGKEGCGLSVHKKVMLDTAALIQLSGQLDAIAADEGCRYLGWDSVLFARGSFHK